MDVSRILQAALSNSSNKCPPPPTMFRAAEYLILWRGDVVKYEREGINLFEEFRLQLKLLGSRRDWR